MATGVDAGELDVPVNKSQVLRSDRPYTKALIGNPDIADIVPISDTSVYVLGKKTGTTSLTLYDRDHLIAVVDIVVGPDVTTLQAPALRTSSGRPDLGEHVERFGRSRRHGPQRCRGGPRGADRRDLRARQGRQPALAGLGAAGDARRPLRRGEALGAQPDRRQLGHQRANEGVIGNGSSRCRNGTSRRLSLTLTARLGESSGQRDPKRLGAIIDSFAIISRTFRAFGADFNVTLDALETKGRGHHARRADAGRAVGRDSELPRRRRIPGARRHKGQWRQRER